MTVPKMCFNLTVCLAKEKNLVIMSKLSFVCLCL